MTDTVSRRTACLGVGAAALAPVAATAAGPGISFPTDVLSDLERTLGAGARVGVEAVQPSTGLSLGYRAGERFAMCSTFKWLLAAFVIEDMASGRPYAEPPRVTYTSEDLVPYAPFTEPRLIDGQASATVDELCEAVVTISDNPAANLLLARIGGPEGFTERVRALGDNVTRLDRWEVELNENLTGDPRDTTSPRAMAQLIQIVLFTDALLSARDRETLRGWMINASTGLARLRAGLPTDWIAGDKTGTSYNGAANDVAFAFPNGDASAPLLIASYIDAPNSDAAARNTAHAAIAALAAKMVINQID